MNKRARKTGYSASSSGCKTCRERKVKCDERKPACAKCEKGKRVCGGFPSLRFVQPETVRSLGLQYQDLRSTENRIDTEEDLFGRRSQKPEFVNRLPPLFAREPISPGPTLQQDPDDVTTCTFLQSVFTENDVLIRDWLQEGQKDRPIAHAVRACGMTVLNNQRGRRDDRYITRQYSLAIHALQCKLSDCAKSKENGTTLAVLLLSIFESLQHHKTSTESGTQAVAWKTHIHGLTKLLKVRGTESLRSSHGLALFFTLRPLIAMGSFWDTHTIPDVVLLWPQLLKRRYTPDAWHGERLYGIFARIAELRADLAASPSSCEAHHGKAACIEEELLIWVRHSDLQYEWQFDILWTSKADGLDYCNDLAYHYRTYHGLAGRNMYHILRIILNQTQNEILQRLQYDIADVQQHASARQEWENQICASVPCALGQTGDIKHSRTPFIRGYAVVWSLFFAGQSIVTAGRGLEDRSKLQWILRKLRYLSETVGVAWAGRIAASLGNAVHSAETEESLHRTNVSPLRRVSGKTKAESWNIDRQLPSWRTPPTPDEIPSEDEIRPEDIAFV